MSKLYDPGKPLNWSKFDSQTIRRANALRSMRGDLLAAGRALQNVARVTLDRETEQKANADSKYFFNKYRSRQGS